LFASKPPVTEKPVDHSPQRPHVLPTAPPPARSEVIQSTNQSHDAEAGSDPGCPYRSHPHLGEVRHDVSPNRRNLWR
jgi:hypothetical protein